MLAKDAEPDKLRFPLLASPKLDGIRATVFGGVLYSRNLKPIPNAHCQYLFGDVNFLDGELIVGPPVGEGVFNRSTSGIMSHGGTPNVGFYVFDHVEHPSDPYTLRFGSLHNALTLIPRKPAPIHTLQQVTIRNHPELLLYEAEKVAEGYEGIMVRSPSAPYKYGRATVNEGYLLKVKRFKDGEARVLGIVEAKRNENEAKINALGHTERSSHKANKVGKDTMGALACQDLITGVIFCIGTGFSDDDRDWWWNHRLKGTVMLPTGSGGRMEEYHLPDNDYIMKYRFQDYGVVDKPRLPSAQGLRDRRDM